MTDNERRRFTRLHLFLSLLAGAIAWMGYAFVSPAWVAELFYATCGGMLFVSLTNAANRVAFDLHAPLRERCVPVAWLLAIGIACALGALYVARAYNVDVRTMYATHVVLAPQRYLLEFAVAFASAALAVLLAGGARR